jgi:hypothetical protein
MEVGMASAEMIVTRRFRMNRKTTSAASRPPTSRCSWISSNDFRMNSDWSRVGRMLMSLGSVVLIRSRREDPIHHFDGVGARLLPNRKRDGVLARRVLAHRRFPQPGLAADLFVRVADAGDLANGDHGAVAVGQDDALEVLDVPQPPERPHRNL